MWNLNSLIIYHLKHVTNVFGPRDNIRRCSDIQPSRLHLHIFLGTYECACVHSSRLSSQKVDFPDARPMHLKTINLSSLMLF